jgi:hypothetical protein
LVEFAHLARSKSLSSVRAAVRTDAPRWQCDGISKFSGNSEALLGQSAVVWWMRADDAVWSARARDRFESLGLHPSLYRSLSSARPQSHGLFVIVAVLLAVSALLAVEKVLRIRFRALPGYLE